MSRHLSKKDLQELHRVKPGKPVVLSRVDCDGGMHGGVRKEESDAALLDLQKTMDGLQDLLSAEHKHKLLIVLQAMDTAGKDGVIRHVFKGMNPQGIRVVSFKVPTAAEQDHDFLWRIHCHVPAKGEIVIFNRSHYEDVLVTRVHKLVEKDVWRRRYGHINAFEKMLADEGVTILKFFLHIDRDEQKARLQARLKVSEKNWKFSAADLKERAFWPKYMEAYEDAINATSTEHAPWYVIPANRKWYRNLAISRILVARLEALGMKYPKPAGLIKPSAIV